MRSRRELHFEVVRVLLVAGCLGCGDKPAIVQPPVPASIEITPDSSVTLNVGDRRQLTVVVRDASENVIGSVGLLGYGDTRSKFQIVSRGPSWVVVDSTGTVTGLAPGGATVVATFPDAKRTLVDSVRVSVTARPP